MRLLIDIGNSYIKAALGKNKVLPETFAKTSYSKEKFNSQFKHFIKEEIKKHKEKILSVGISLCNKDFKGISNKIIIDNFNLKPYFISFDSKLPIKINYPKTLGVDRICSSVAAVSIYKEHSNILVIDYGTATTFNIISNKTFIGGLISPGVETCLKSLIENTELPKPRLDIRKIKIISKDTKTSILSGVLYQTIGLTELVIGELEKKYKNILVISAGGFGEILSKKIKKIKKYNPLLVLIGINEILKLNSKIIK